MRKIDEVIRRLDDFPTLPAIYSELLDVLADPNTTPRRLARYISMDPSAASKMLRTVNSPIFGLQSKVDSMQEAVFHIGFNEVKNLMLAIAVIEMFSKMESIDNFNIRDFWKHSIAVGVISKLLGAKLKIRNVEPYFLAGILHDIGKIFFLRMFSDDYCKAIETAMAERIRLSDVELRFFGINHLEIGCLIVERWNLPENIRHTINSHNDGKLGDEYKEQQACIYLADRIANILELGIPTRFVVQRPDPEIWNFLRVEPDLIESIFPDIMEAYFQAISISLSAD